MEKCYPDFLRSHSSYAALIPLCRTSRAMREWFKIVKSSGLRRPGHERQICPERKSDEISTVFSFWVRSRAGRVYFVRAESGFRQSSSAHYEGSASRTADAPVFRGFRQYRLQGRWLQSDLAGTG